MIDTLNSLNQWLFWIMNSPHGPLFDSFMIVITATGYTIPAFIIGYLAFRLYGIVNKKNLILLAVAMLAGGVVVQGIKQVYIKDRPLGYYGETNLSLQAKVHAPFTQPHHRTFPSGHSQTAFGVAMIIFLLVGRDRWFWFSWATLVALSRVYLGLHWPIDIVAGSIIGALASWFTCRIYKQS